MLTLPAEILEALAHLSPMPRTPLTINPCPDGYNLQNVGGKLICVLEGAEAFEPQLDQGAPQIHRRTVGHQTTHMTHTPIGPQ